MMIATKEADMDPIHSRAIKRTFSAKYGPKKLVSVVPGIDGDKIYVFCVGNTWVHKVGDRKGLFRSVGASASDVTVPGLNRLSRHL